MKSRGGPGGKRFPPGDSGGVPRGDPFYQTPLATNHAEEGQKSPGVRGIPPGDPLGVIYGGFRGPFGGIPWGNPPGGSQGVTFCDFLFWVFVSFFSSVFGKTDPG